MLGALGLLIWWYGWGVIAGLVICAAVAAWVLFDSQRRIEDALMTAQQALVWRILSLAGLVLTLPSLYSKFQTWDRILSGNITGADVVAALQIYSNLQLFAYLGVLGIVLAVIAAFGHLWTIQQTRAAYVSPPRGDTVPYEPVPEPTRTARKPRLQDTEVYTEPRRPMAWLAVKSGQRRGKQFGLTKGRNIIGRDGASCDLVLDDPKVSGRHASIRYENGVFVLKDLDSRNHTFVNKRRVDRQTLMDDDEITVGKTKLVFKEVKS
jgi:hypothetical protein